MDILDLDRQALAVFGRLLRELTDDDLPRPTPCEQWDVGDLIRHVVGGNVLFAETADAGSADWDQRQRDRLGSSPVAAFEESAAQVTGSFSREGVLTEMLELPFGRYPGEVGLAVHFVDVLVHAWDLAAATGQESEFPDDLVAVADQIVDLYPKQMWGDPRYFDHPRPQPGGAATPTLQLVARLGRDPDWEQHLQ